MTISYDVYVLHKKEMQERFTNYDIGYYAWAAYKTAEANNEILITMQKEISELKEQIKKMGQV